jgi:hypothetical protein
MGKAVAKNSGDVMMRYVVLRALLRKLSIC